MHDIVIAGAGKAGLFAAIEAAKDGLKTLVVSHGMDYDKSTSKQKASDHGFEITDDKIIGISGFDEIIINGIHNDYKCRALILAIDVPVRDLQISGIEKFKGNGISFCAACDGFFYRDKKIAVLGYNDFMAHEASEIKKLSDNVTVLTNGMPLDMAKSGKDIIKNLAIEQRKISGFYGGDYLLGIAFESGEKEQFDGVFIAYGDATALEISLKTGLLTENGKIATDGNQCTNLPNIFAAGGCSANGEEGPGEVEEGKKAARSAVKYIRNNV